jgi:NDP-sugar pyrophosphorylase family protein
MLPALVLTAGYGRRLDPLTRLVAKPAVPLGDRSLIERVLDWLRAQDATNVVLNLHHRPATITTILGDGAHLGLSLRYSWEQPLLGSAGGPRHALPLLDADTFLIVNGDTLCDFDLAPMVAAHLDSEADVTMAVLPNPAPDHYNGILMNADQVVTGFVPRGYPDLSWHFIGVQVAHARAFAHLQDGVPSETVAGFYRDVVRASPGRIRGWRPKTTFLDVGTPRDYLNAALRWPPEAGSGQTAGSRLVRSVVWRQAEIGPDVELVDCLVIGDVHVPAGFRARSAVLAPPRIVETRDRAETRDGVAVFAMSDSNIEGRTSRPHGTSEPAEP